MKRDFKKDLKGDFREALEVVNEHAASASLAIPARGCHEHPRSPAAIIP
jgi:hypothetical protein